jgi:hypothetical protein
LVFCFKTLSSPGAYSCGASGIIVNKNYCPLNIV